jgi:NDP-sugar pyrophosphorylase family protein
MAEELSRYELILLQNADILSAIDVAPAITMHRERGALVTMIVLAGCAPRRPPASLLVLEDRAVAAIGAHESNEREGAVSTGYTGMAVLSPEALDFFPRGRAGGLIEAVLDIIAARPGSVVAYDPSENGSSPLWGEIGSIAGYLDIHRRILVERTVFDPLILPPPLPLFVGEDSSIDPAARWRGFLAVGSRVTIERDTMLEDCVVLDGTVISEGSGFRRAVVYPGGAAEA